jgi:hypothetical protein
VVIKSWRQPAVSIQGGSFTAVQDGDIRISGQSSLYLAVPEKASLSLGRIQGDLTIKHVAGGVAIDEVAGDAAFTNLDAVHLKKAHQAVAADNVNGTLVVEQADGDVALRSVSGVQLAAVSGQTTIRFANGRLDLGEMGGRLELASVNGDVVLGNGRADVVLQNMGGIVTLPVVAGDVWLVGGLRAGQHRLASAQTVYVYWPEAAPLRLLAAAPIVESRLPLSRQNEVTEDGQTTLTGDIEEGETWLTLKAEQRIALIPLGAKPPRFSPDEFLFAPEPSAELALRVQTAVHAVLAEFPEMEGLEERLVTAVVAALGDDKVTK